MAVQLLLGGVPARADDRGLRPLPAAALAAARAADPGAAGGPAVGVAADPAGARQPGGGAAGELPQPAQPDLRVAGPAGHVLLVGQLPGRGAVDAGEAG